VIFSATFFKEMKISVPKETHPGETRAPLTPNSATKLVKLGVRPGRGGSRLTPGPATDMLS
jgi:hypothetical protein